VRIAPYLTAAIILAVLIVLGGNTLSGATETPTASPSPSAAPTATPPPVVAPASLSVVTWARHWRRAAVRQWTRWNHARGCLGMRHVRFGAPQPRRSADKATWTAAGAKWKAMRGDYRHRTRTLVGRMVSPGGGGAARWLPLAKWTGWPAKSWGALIAIMTRESGGSPHVWNRQGSRCFGLLQLAPCHWIARGLAWIWSPMHQLWKGLQLYRGQGDSFLPAWAL
jgi:hypothetical protein